MLLALDNFIGLVSNMIMSFVQWVHVGLSQFRQWGLFTERMQVKQEVFQTNFKVTESELWLSHVVAYVPDWPLHTVTNEVYIYFV